MGELDDLLDPGINEGNNNNNPAGYVHQQPIPNAVTVLVLGIISIVGCFLYGVPGLICGIIALSIHGKVKKIHATDPAKYRQSFNIAKAGFICAVIGTSLSALYFLIFVLIIIGAISGSRF